MGPVVDALEGKHHLIELKDLGHLLDMYVAANGQSYEDPGVAAVRPSTVSPTGAVGLKLFGLQRSVPQGSIQRRSKLPCQV